MSSVVILQLMFISIGMAILGFVLNKILGIKKENFIDLRKKAQNLQERMKNAQAVRDVQMMMQLQQESVQFMKKLLKKQVIPLCLRCSLFIGIFIVLGFIYGDYNSGLLPFPILFLGDGWFAIYFLFSLGFALIIYGIRKLYKKLTGKETKTQNQLKNIMKIMSPSKEFNSHSYQFGGPMPSQSQYQINNQNISTPEEENQHTSNKGNSWKERIEK
ncbi:hypothetical protein LCGC14_2109400 [marine sediment metagenome]|uniref:DUF106 domain-containing protein n=1 Tax=marine sediment metagenome TaxID=412755 RepID=A0A0F9GKQ9_9ZZZZ